MVGLHSGTIFEPMLNSIEQKRVPKIVSKKDTPQDANCELSAGLDAPGDDALEFTILKCHIRSDNLRSVSTELRAL